MSPRPGGSPARPGPFRLDTDGTFRQQAAATCQLGQSSKFTSSTVLRDEVTSALTGAFGKLGTEPDNIGRISGDYLPLSVDRAPFSQ